MIDLDAFISLAKSRRSVRRFRPDAVPPELVARLIEAASWAPSPGNRQAWEFIAISSQDKKMELASAVRAAWSGISGKCVSDGIREELENYSRNFYWFHSAPLLIAIMAKKPEGFIEAALGQGASAVSGYRTAAAMASQNLMLAACAAGLGSCCLTGPLAAESEIKKIIGAGPRLELVCLLALGYLDGEPDAPSRKPESEIMRSIG